MVVLSYAKITQTRGKKVYFQFPECSFILRKGIVLQRFTQEVSCMEPGYADVTFTVLQRVAQPDFTMFNHQRFCFCAIISYFCRLIMVSL